jgi:hypothetical protein
MKSDVLLRIKKLSIPFQNGEIQTKKIQFDKIHDFQGKPEIFTCSICYF